MQASGRHCNNRPIDVTSLSDTPEMDNKPWCVCTCSLTACLRHAPGHALRRGAEPGAANAKPDQRCLHAVDHACAFQPCFLDRDLVGEHSLSQGWGRPTFEFRGSPRSHLRNTCISISSDAAYTFERIASAKVTIRPRPSSHSAWRDARNPSARVSTDATVKAGCASWQASSR